MTIYDAPIHFKCLAPTWRWAFLLALFCSIWGMQPAHAQLSTLNADSVYAFINSQFGFLAQAPDSLPPYLQREALQNTLKGGSMPNTIFSDRIREMNTDMLDTLLSSEDIQHMKALAQQQSLYAWKTDSLQIAGVEIIGKKELKSILHQKKNRISLAFSPPYFSRSYEYALLMVERRSASEGWDALLLWQRQSKGWKVVDAKMWLWHPVTIER